jgi:hypothetical protein
MDSVTYQANDKNSPVWLKIEPHEPTTAYRWRFPFAKTLAVFLLLLLWFLFPPDRFGTRKSDTVVDPNKDGGFTFEDFDKVWPLSTS